MTASVLRRHVAHFALTASLMCSVLAFADDEQLQVPAGQILDIVTGASSSVSDGVMFRVSGQVASASCYYAGYNVSLFYAKPGGAVDPKKALAILMVAKLANRSITLQFNSASISTDFWNYGISSCEITRLSVQ